MNHHYSDVVSGVQAVLNDTPGSVYTSEFILPYVNVAQRTLAATLLSHGVEEVKVRTEPPIYLPAGTTELTAIPTQFAPQNVLAHSDNFSTIGALAFDTWATTPTVTPTALQSDPFGGVTATKWTYLAASTLTACAEANYQAPAQAATYVTSHIWLKADVPGTLAICAGLDAAGATPTGTSLTSKLVNVTTDWQRYTVTHGPIDTTSSTLYGKILLKADKAIDINFYLARAGISYSQYDEGDSPTALVSHVGPPPSVSLGAVYATPPVLPQQLIAPDFLWEAPVGAQNQDYLPMSGPQEIPNISQSSILRYWNWTGQTIRFLGCTVDRLIRIDYWTFLNDFVSRSEPVVISGSLNALVFLTAMHCADARGQHELAQSFGVLDAGGVMRGKAGFEIYSLVNAQVRANQIIPLRRQPYFGYARYPRYGRTRVGGM